MRQASTWLVVCGSQDHGDVRETFAGGSCGGTDLAPVGQMSRHEQKSWLCCEKSKIVHLPGIVGAEHDQGRIGGRLTGGDESLDDGEADGELPPGEAGKRSMTKHCAAEAQASCGGSMRQSKGTEGLTVVCVPSLPQLPEAVRLVVRGVRRSVQLEGSRAEFRWVRAGISCACALKLLASAQNWWRQLGGRDLRGPTGAEQAQNHE